MFKMLNGAAKVVALSLVLGSSVQAAAEQCTDYVKNNNSLYVGFNAHAKDWYSYGKNWGFRQRERDEQPEAGDVIVVNGVGDINGTNPRRYGHVMLIRSIDSFTDIKNFTAVVGHANYPNSGDSVRVVVKNGSFNNTPVLGVITPRDVGFGVVTGTNTELTFDKGQLSRFEVTLRYVGKQVGNTKGLLVKPEHPQGTAQTHFSAVNFYKFFEDIDPSPKKQLWNSYAGELKPGVDYKLQFFATPHSSIKGKQPYWCLESPTQKGKLGCFRFLNVTVK